MAREYFYFLASLPSLHWDQSPSLSVEDLVQQARRLCEPQDAAILEKVLALAEGQDLEPASNEPHWVRHWRAFLRSWRRAMVQVRADLLNHEVRDEMDLDAQVDPWAIEAAAQAAEAADPLEAETVLMRFLWMWLDQQETRFGLFARERIWIYGLKLFLLQRFVQMSDERAQTIWTGYEKEALSVL